MSDQAVQQFEALARKDPTVAVLAKLLAEVVRAAADPAWDRATPELVRPHGAIHTPLLEGQTLTFEPGRVRELLLRLTRVAEPSANGRVAPLRRAIADGTLDSLPLLTASVAADVRALDAVAEQAGVDAALLATLAHAAAIPLLLACGRKAAPLLPGAAWTAGYCPVCAAWPALSELRGLERQRWLRCGRCGAGWAFEHQRCAFCDNVDHATLGYLAAEEQRDARRAETCDRCRGYLKALATLGPLAPHEVLLQDLATVELDVAALEQEYGRPTAPGHHLPCQIVPAPHHNGRWRWRR